MVTKLKELGLWRYYFWDLPLFALGKESSRLLTRDSITGERAATISGIRYLKKRMGEHFCALDSERIATWAYKVRLVRESDTFAVLGMRTGTLNRWFNIVGLDHIRRARKQGRPIILLGGHLGSNYTMWIALGYLGHTVFTVARAVDRSPTTPAARQAYMALTYLITGCKWPGRYLLADAHGHFPKGQFPRILKQVFQQNGICFVAVDFPPTLYRGKQAQVEFLGASSRLPVGVLELGLEQKAAMIPVWDCVDFEGKRRLRRIVFGPPLEGNTAGSQLQDYANRLTTLICREPWQWMGLPVVRQFH